MRGTIPPLPKYDFMVLCSVKAQGQLCFYLYSDNTKRAVSVTEFCRNNEHRWMRSVIISVPTITSSVLLTTRAVCKFLGLTFLLRVGTLWRCDDGLFRSTSLSKRCTSYNAPPISRKRAADSWTLRNFLPWSSLFMVEKAQKSHGTGSGLYGGCSDGVPPIQFFQAEHRIQFRSRPM
jgi:hypothetical protein